MLHLPADDREAKCLVIFKPTIGPAFGLLVDEVGEIASVRKQDIEDDESDLSMELQGPSGLIPYICRLPDRLLVALDAKKNLTPH
jgi:chemotaxis signal transduction protein